MRRYNGIVESESAPSKFDLWMFRGSLKYFGLMAGLMFHLVKHKT